MPAGSPFTVARPRRTHTAFPFQPVRRPGASDIQLLRLPGPGHYMRAGRGVSTQSLPLLQPLCLTPRDNLLRMLRVVAIGVQPEATSEAGLGVEVAVRYRTEEGHEPGVCLR